MQQEYDEWLAEMRSHPERLEAYEKFRVLIAQQKHEPWWNLHKTKGE